MNCSKCNEELTPESQFCQHCGTKVVIENEAADEVATIKINEGESISVIDEKPNYHPWRRFFARTVDIMLGGLLVSYTALTLVGNGSLPPPLLQLTTV
jgi:hypothetical protein